ncbi:MAG: hypothetical protein M3337_00420 [Actinomycetota bacterium]|nr:hypothetical protein [Actinomycetota bacterium]
MAGNPLNDPNFAASTAATVERVVGNVRRRAVQPLVYAARATVFGVLGAFLAVMALVLLLVALTRGLQALLDIFVSQPRAVYLSYLIVGALLCIVGLVLMAKRAPKATTTDR